MLNEISKLKTPTLEDFREEFPKPEIISGPINEINGATKVTEGRKYNNGWITPRGNFFECSYAGHDIWAENLFHFWPEIIIEEFPSYLNIRTFEDDYFKRPDSKFKTYQEMNDTCKRKWKYNYDLSIGDYLVSLGWMKWTYRQIYHEIIRDEKREISTLQWSRISWLSIHSSAKKYKFYEVDI